MQCRFNGHFKTFYTVAEHSIRVHDLYCTDRIPYDQDTPLWALLHDAAEAYTGDLIKPIKKNMQTSEFADIEYRFEMAIAERFSINLTQKVRDTVSIYDERMLNREHRFRFDSSFQPMTCKQAFSVFQEALLENLIKA